MKLRVNLIWVAVILLLLAATGGSNRWLRGGNLIVIVMGASQTKGYEEFSHELKGRRWGYHSSLYFGRNKRDLEKIRNSNTIFIIRPEYLYDLENLEAEYPDLLPVSTEKLEFYLKSYGTPLLYFSRDSTDKIRGIVIAEKVNASLAKQLTREPLRLDIPLGYKFGKLRNIKKNRNTFSWNREDGLIVTVIGIIRPEGYEKVFPNLQKLVPSASYWEYPFFPEPKKNKEYREKIRNSNTIFVIRQHALYKLEDLGHKLLPISYRKLKFYSKSYGVPLLYFSRDFTGKIRGVIIAEEISAPIINLLTEEPIPLNTPLGVKLIELETEKKLEKEKTFTWNYKERLIITFTGGGFTGLKEFAKEARKVYGRRFNAWGTRSLLDYTKNKGRIEAIRSNNTIFTVRPESLYDLEDLEAEYPDLLPIPAEKLKSYLKTYGYPLLYFSLDYIGILRGVIIAEEVTPALAKLLVEKLIPLDTPLGYQNGRMEKLEK